MNEGVRRVHLVGSQVEGGLLRELYTRDGCGLMLHADADYERWIVDEVPAAAALLDARVTGSSPLTIAFRRSARRSA